MSQYQYNPDQIDKNFIPRKEKIEKSQLFGMFFFAGSQPWIYEILKYISYYILVGDTLYTFGFQFMFFDLFIGWTEILYSYLPPIFWQIAGSVVMIFYFGGLLMRFSRVSLLFQLSSLAFIAVQIIYILVLVQAAPENPYGLACTLPAFGTMNNSPYATYQLILGILFISLLVLVPYTLQKKTGKAVGIGVTKVKFFCILFIASIIYLYFIHLLAKWFGDTSAPMEIGNDTTLDIFLSEDSNGYLYFCFWSGGVLLGSLLCGIISLISLYLPQKFKRGDQEEVDSADIQVVGVDTTTEYDT